MHYSKTKTREQSSVKATTEDEKIWQQAKLEHDAAGKVLDALRPLSQNERRRIMDYMWDRYVEHPDPKE